MSFKEELLKINDVLFTESCDLSKSTTFRLKSVGDYIEVKSIKALSDVLLVLHKYHQDYLVLGWGANQILPPKLKAPVIHLAFPIDLSVFDSVKNEYELPASLGLNVLTAHAVKFGLKGWEVFTGIPASLGGAIFMNAGTNLGEIGKLIKSVKVMNKFGEIRDITIDESSFSYRHNHFIEPGDIIISAVMIHLGEDALISQKIRDYMEYRRSSQPLATKNCGCVFKNPHKELPAGKLIDLLQLKGVSQAGLRVSPKHGNFIENAGEASWDDFSKLVGLIKLEMDHFYGLEFELEVKIPYD